MGEGIDKIQDALNRGRRERLNKAAKQGYGPLVDLGLVAAPRRAAPEASDRGRARGSRGQDPKHGRMGDSEGEADVNGFLAPKRPGDAQKKASGPLKLEVRISAGSATRAVAASSGARPKAAPTKDHDQDAEELLQRELEEKAALEFEEMQAEAKRVAKAAEETVEETRGPSPSGEGGKDTERHRQREEKRKREDWRRRRREEKRRRAKHHKRVESSRSESSEEEAETKVEAKAKAEPSEDPRQRFIMWQALNNNGVTTARDVQRKYVGQVTDAALDMRLREHQEPSSLSGGKLMTEAEVLAKLQRKKS